MNKNAVLEQYKIVKIVPVEATQPYLHGELIEPAFLRVDLHVMYKAPPTELPVPVLNLILFFPADEDVSVRTLRRMARKEMIESLRDLADRLDKDVPEGGENVARSGLASGVFPVSSE